MKRIASGKSNAKIIMIGEHSVVYGQPAIATPLTQINTVVTLKTTGNGHQVVHSRYFDGPRAALPQSMAGIQALLNVLDERLGSAKQGWEMTIDSKLPAERGMGSSAAVAVAITRAFFNLYEQPLDHGLLLQLADVEEEITHRNPSGLDAATSSVITPLWYIKNQTSQPLDSALNATMVIADTGVKGATKDAIAAVADQLKTNHEEANRVINHLGQLATSFRICLAANEPSKLGIIMNQAQADLKQLNVSSPELDHLCRAAIENGALGAKLTGGGRGGCMYALTKTRAEGERLAEQLEAAGAHQTWLQTLGNGGGK